MWYRVAVCLGPSSLLVVEWPIKLAKDIETESFFVGVVADIMVYNGTREDEERKQRKEWNTVYLNIMFY